jgi:dsDNA-specific endonuclease/ATPase MutS2
MTLLEWFRRWLSMVAQRARGDEARAVESLPVEDDAEVDPFNPFPEPVRVEITDIIDLHTIPPRDVKRVVEAYLEEAHHAGFPSVRLIHGKGRGVQREIVRKILSRTPFVKDFTDAPPQAGGWGATVAHLTTDKRAPPSQS